MTATIWLLLKNSQHGEEKEEADDEEKSVIGKFGFAKKKFAFFV